MDNLAKRNLVEFEDDLNCKCCGVALENAYHIFIGCGMAMKVWEMLAKWCGCSWENVDNLGDFFIKVTKCWVMKKKKIGIAIWHCTIWEIWKARNEVRFNGKVVEVSKIVEKVIFNVWFWCKEGGCLGSEYRFWSLVM